MDQPGTAAGRQSHPDPEQHHLRQQQRGHRQGLPLGPRPRACWFATTSPFSTASPTSTAAPRTSLDPASSNNLSEDGHERGVQPGGRIGHVDACPRLLFVNAAGGNLHIGAASSAANVGADLSAVFDDGHRRRQRQAPWDIGADEFAATTAVKLQSFSAVAGDRSVVLEWRTASELDNLGFHLYRGPSEGGPWTRLNASLDSRARLLGGGPGVLVPRHGPRERDALLLPAGGRGRVFEGDARTARSRPCRWPGRRAARRGASLRRAARARRRRALPRRPAPTGWWRPTAPRRAPRRRRRSPARGTAIPRRCRWASSSRDSRQATLELRTGGFYALHEASGRGARLRPRLRLPAGPAGRRRCRSAARSSTRSSGRRVAARRRAGARPAWASRASSRPRSARPRCRCRGTARCAPAAARCASRAAARLDASSRGCCRVCSRARRRAPSWRSRRCASTPGAGSCVLARRVLVQAAVHGARDGRERPGQLGPRPGPREACRRASCWRGFTRRAVGLHAVALRAALPGPRQRGLAGIRAAARAAGRGGGLPRRAGLRGLRPRQPALLPRRAGRRLDRLLVRGGLRAVRSREGVRDAARSRPRRRGRGRDRRSSRLASFETNRFYQPGLLEAPDLVAVGGARLGGDAGEELLARRCRRHPATAELDVFLQGASESGQPVDHHVSVSVNGTLVGEAQFAGKQPYRMSLSLPASLLREGANELSLTNVADTGVTSLVFLDRFTRRPCAARRRSRAGCSRGPGPRAAPPRSRASRAPPRSSTCSAATGGARWLSGYEASGGSVRFHAEAGHRYLVASAAALLTPRVAAPAAVDAARDHEPGRLPADRSAGLPDGRRAARAAPAGPGALGARRRVRGDRRRVRPRAAVRRGDPELPGLRLPVVGAALAALRAAARRLELRPAELHRHVSAVAAARAVDEDLLPLDRVRPAARRGQRRGRAARPGDRPAARPRPSSRRRCSSRSCSPGRTPARVSRVRRRSSPTTPTSPATSRRTCATSPRATSRGAASCCCCASSAPRRGRAILDASNSGLSYLELRRPWRGGGVGERERLELLGRGDAAGAVAAAAAA